MTEREQNAVISRLESNWRTPERKRHNRKFTNNQGQERTKTDFLCYLYIKLSKNFVHNDEK